MLRIYAASAPWPLLKGHIRDIRPIWYLEEIGEKYERVALDPSKKENKTESYLRVHPMGKVPALQDGDLTLFESGAICLHLANKFGKLTFKPGTDDYSQMLQWIFSSVTNIEPHAARIFGCDNMYEKNEKTAHVRELAVSVMSGPLKATEDQLRLNGYLVGKQFTVADIMLSSILRFILDDPIVTGSEVLSKYLEKNFARPAFQRALALNGIPTTT